MLKRIFSIFAIALIITGLFFEGYSLKCPVYADDTTDGWLNVTTNEQLVEAFKYYCKSRDLTIEGSVADAVTSFTTKTFNGICNTLGIDVTALQAQLKYKTDGNQGIQFLFTTTGVDAYNQIFAQFLQDNDLEVGDSDVNKTVYSGRYFTDDQGNSCLVFVYTASINIGSATPSTIGTPYIYDFDYISTHESFTSTNSFTNISYTMNFAYTTYSTNGGGYRTAFSVGDSGSTVISNFSTRSNKFIGSGYSAIGFNTTNNKYYVGCYNYLQNDSVANTFFPKKMLDVAVSNSDETNITIVSNTINNNTYEGDTIINNEGDIINNNPDNPDNPDLPPSNPTVPDSGGWEDFQMPTMPNDWLIYGMEKKFPFDIPFNIMFGLSLLNHEPEIPKFEGDIDLKVCTWHYNIDLTPFDDIAKILRKFEVLAFIIGLAILTKELIMWG